MTKIREPHITLMHVTGEYAMHPDNCDRCAGISGGVRGNENIIEGRVLCDYCTVAIDRGSPKELHCPDCDRALSTHKLLKIGEIEEFWKAGIILTICGGEGHEYPPPDSLILVAVPNSEPEDPCDEDFMKEISS